MRVSWAPAKVASQLKRQSFPLGLGNGCGVQLSDLDDVHLRIGADTAA